MYATGNPKTKAELKRRTALAPECHGTYHVAGCPTCQSFATAPGVAVFSPGPFGCPTDGPVTIEGPHYPAPHRWYATATLRDGFIVPGSVK